MYSQNVLVDMQSLMNLGHIILEGDKFLMGRTEVEFVRFEKQISGSTTIVAFGMETVRTTQYSDFAIYKLPNGRENMTNPFMLRKLMNKRIVYTDIK